MDKRWSVYVTQAGRPENLGTGPPFACVPRPFRTGCFILTVHSTAHPGLSASPFVLTQFESTGTSGAAGHVPVPVFPSSRGHSGGSALPEALHLQGWLAAWCSRGTVLVHEGQSESDGCLVGSLLRGELHPLCPSVLHSLFQGVRCNAWNLSSSLGPRGAFEDDGTERQKAPGDCELLCSPGAGDSRERRDPAS